MLAEAVELFLEEASAEEVAARGHVTPARSP